MEGKKKFGISCPPVLELPEKKFKHVRPGGCKRYVPAIPSKRRVKIVKRKGDDLVRQGKRMRAG